MTIPDLGRGTTPPAETPAELPRRQPDVRDRVRDAAAKVFLAKGYGDATIQDIADELCLPKGSAYHHLRSKEDALFSVVCEGLRGMVERLKLIAEFPLSAEDRLRLALRDNVRSTVEDMNARVATTLHHDMRALTDEHRVEVYALRAQYEAFFMTIIEAGISSGEFRPLRSARIAVFGMFGMLSYFHRWFRVDGTLSYGEVAEIWNELVLQGLGADRGQGGAPHASNDAGPPA